MTGFHNCDGRRGLAVIPRILLFWPRNLLYWCMETVRFDLSGPSSRRAVAVL